MPLCRSLPRSPVAILFRHDRFRVLAVALVAALGCDGSGGGDIDRGGPFTGNKADAAADAASDARASDAATNTDAARDVASDAKADAADAKVDVAPGSGGAGVTGSGGASGGGGTGAGGGASVQTCDQCEAANCGAVNMIPDYRTACHDPKDSGGNPAKAAAGPAAGTLRKTLCEAVLSCVRSNTDRCVTWTVEKDGFEGVQGCYCGKDTSDDDCQSGKANGPCKAAIEAAAEVGSAASAGPDVAQRLVDWQTYAIGAATNIVQECDAVFCRNSCLGLPGPNSLRATGTGGTVAAAGGRSGGTGGATGTGSGGRTGTGTGGNSGSGGAGTTGSGGAGGGTSGGAGSSGGGVTYNMCRACEQTACPEALNGCEQMPGNAEAGPKMGTPRKELCKAVVACARASKCPVEGDATACYCGTADVDGACMSGGANGPCKAEVEAAAESTDFKDIGPRFVNSDPTMKLPFAIASATDLLGCDGFSCADARCLIGDPAPVATGGAPGGGGAGGRANTGGVSGVGGMGGGTLGAGGSGGRGGVGGAAGTGTGSAGVTGGMGGGGSAGGNGGGSSTSSVLVNGAFDTTAAPWTAGFGATLAWTGARDAAGSSASGALGVTYANVVDADGTTMGGAQQCVRVNGGAIYSLGARVVVPSGQGAGSAMVNLSFFPTTMCTGTVNGSYPSTAVTATDVWTMVSGTTVAPAAAQSVLVQLALVKTFRAPALQAYFDAVAFGSP